MIALLRRLVLDYYSQSGQLSYDWAGQAVCALRPQRLLDVGCGDGSRLFAYLDGNIPVKFCGVEGSPTLAEQARQRGLEVTTFDLNSRWPYETGSFEVIHSSQVIEHVHNTRLFLEEIFRVLAPGGTAILTSENLTSFLNTGAMVMGYTPFSSQSVCGWYVGNPLGLHDGKSHPGSLAGVPVDHPAFSGISGHNRVLSVVQARDLLKRIGYVDLDTRSIGLMPLPQWLGRLLETSIPRRGHWLLLRARKPASTPK